VEKRLNSYGTNRKGFLGGLVEEFVFGLSVNNNSEADFKIAGVELKTNPLKSHPTKVYISKERLVFSLINYDEIVQETWETSSFLKKNRVLLILFYLWMKEQSLLDYKFKFVYLMNLLEDISDVDIFQIRKDWEYIVAKIRRGEAHLLSEGDTYYLGACTKAANSQIVREQPNNRIPAKPRAFSLKQQYLNYIIQKELLGKDIETDSIFKKTRRIESVDDAFKEKLRPYIGKTDKEIIQEIGWKGATKAKNYRRILVNKMLGVSSNRIEELEKANVTLRVVTLEHTGSLRESISFPAFDYNELVIQEWENEEDGTMTDFHLALETRRFLFIVFQKIVGSSEIVLKKIKFWNFPMKDMTEAKRVWEKAVECVREGHYGDLPKMIESAIAHVRPHGKDLTDTLETPQGTREVKRCFWLNANYIRRVVEDD
ncbi:MAG: Sau3AI family type II restriction endonuclease, partial [Candidatus Moraniibacteriota bacterium]